MFKKICIFAITFISAETVFEDGVVVMTADNFDEEIIKQEHYLVEFYAPWCGHCKTFAPEYAAAAKVLGSLETPIHIAKVDAAAAENQPLSSRFSISSLPTVIWFKNGERQSDYLGERNKESVVKSVKSAYGLQLSQVGCDGLQGFVDANEITIAYFGAKDTAMHKDGFKQYMSNIGDKRVEFVHVDDTQCAPKAQESMVIYKNFEEPIETYQGKVNITEISKFFNTRLTPTSYLFAEGYFSDLTFVKGSPTIFIYRPEEDADSEFMQTFKEAARQNYGKIYWTYSDIFGSLQREVAEFLQIGLKTKYYVRAGYKNKAYILEVESKDLTVDILTKFADDLLADKLKPYPFKSEEVPETQGTIFKAVGSTYEELVNQAGKVILMEYYAPWCGFCKKLAPIYEELAEHFKGRDEIVIAQIDMTVNDVASVGVNAYPTIILFKDGQLTWYDGEREFEELKAFVEENAGAPKVDESVKDDL